MNLIKELQEKKGFSDSERTIADYLLKHLFDRLKQDFLEKGGIKEEMTRGRLEYRKKQQGY